MFYETSVISTEQRKEVIRLLIDRDTDRLIHERWRMQITCIIHSMAKLYKFGLRDAGIEEESSLPRILDNEMLLLLFEYVPGTFNYNGYFGYARIIFIMIKHLHLRL